jgi:hypothetical protein
MTLSTRCFLLIWLALSVATLARAENLDASGRGAPPANDSCETAQAVSNADFPIADSLATATSSYNLNFGKQGISNGPDVWLDFTAADDGLYEFSFAPTDLGDDFALIFIQFQDCDLFGGLEGVNDGGPGATESQSFNFQNGEAITFMLRGFSTDDNGAYTFSLIFTPGASVENWEAY